MKKFNVLLLMAALLGFASCSSDDETPAASPAEQTAGVYNGYTVASCAYFSNQLATDQTLTITQSSETQVNIDFVSDTWGTIRIDNADLTATEGGFSISGKGTSLMGHGNSNAKEYECNVSGTVCNGTADLNFNCPAIMGGLNIAFKQGTIPAGIVVPGTYNGYTEAKSTYFSGMMAEDQSLTVTGNENGTYNINFVSDTWGEFTIENVSVTTSENQFSLSGNGKCTIGMNGQTKEYDCSLTATIDIDKENPTFTFSVPAVMGGLSIVFQTGDMPVTE